jgi:GTPase
MQFVDEVTIKVVSGDGGNGMVAWRREKYEPLGGPAGGTGGRGGHVFLQASGDISTLLDFHYKMEFKAPKGANGGPKNRTGKDGEDLTIRVPVGTVVKDLQSDRIVADLSCDEQKVMLAEGGRGGRGNAALSTQANRAPYYCEPGESGIDRHLQLTLKLIADAGLIGLPNAGKSTLLSVLTAARPKIADYPFSTLAPNLGVMRRSDGDGYVLADIPGLVEGASQGIGLGHKFLRHIERTRVLVHLADISSEHLADDLMCICTELAFYDERVARMPQIVFLNKADLLLPEEVVEVSAKIEADLKNIFPYPDSIAGVMPGSCATTIGVDELAGCLLELLARTPRDESVFQALDDEGAYQHPDAGFVVTRKKGSYFVAGNRVERMLAVTNLRSPESLQHFFHVLRAMGVIDAALSQGLSPGDEVVIGKTSFSYGEDMF